MANLLAVVLIALITASAAFAQKKPIFTSTYTSLGGKACKVLRGGDGQDDAKLCTGPGGYKVRIYSSATMTHIVAELTGSDETFSIANVGLAFDESRSRVEWRHAQGKPFAVILRVPTYAERPDGEPGVGKITGYELVVIGLKGFSDLHSGVDAKTRGANSLAREEADSAYLAK